MSTVAMPEIYCGISQTTKYILTWFTLYLANQEYMQKESKKGENQNREVGICFLNYNKIILSPLIHHCQ